MSAASSVPDDRDVRLEPLSFQTIVDILPVGAMICHLDPLEIDHADPRPIDLLHQIRDTLGIDPSDIVGTSVDAFHRDPGLRSRFPSDAANHPQMARIRCRDEWLDLQIHPLADSRGRIGQALLVWAVATAEVAEGRKEDRLLRMIDDMPLAVMTLDPSSFAITYLNETAKRTLGPIAGRLPTPASELLGASIDVVHEAFAHPRALLSDPANLPHRTTIQLGSETLDLQVSAVTGADGAHLGPMLTWSAITQQVAAEARIHQLAHYDALTGLANRSTIREHLDAALRRPGARLGLLFIDLDGFKIVNDSNGYLVGDSLLRRVADRLRIHCDAREILVGRLGGDEFAILFEGAGIAEAGQLAQALIAEIVEPYSIEADRRLSVGASIGIAVSPDHGTTSETLLSRADMALHAAKAAGRKTFRVFTPELETRLYERVRLEGKLRKALVEMDGLFLFYQPITDIATGRVTAREGLIRWHHAVRGWISPGEFIPVAEESGLIDELGIWVLGEACREAATWTDGARVAVNVSARQLGKGMLVAHVLEALVASGLEPGRLEIEVTESALLSNELDCLSDLRRVRDLGVRVALDDFGTGFSSLAHLRSFPFDKIKIDGSFVRDAVRRPDCAAIVGVLADLGRRLGVTTVAEGVETQAHLDLVTAEGCTEVQGYLLGRPGPSKADAERVARLSVPPLRRDVAC